MEKTEVSLSLVLKKRGSPDGSKSVPKASQESLTEEQSRQLLTAPPADVMSDQPCSTCGSRERWEWLDGRLLCRICLIFDLTPLTLRRGNTSYGHGDC
jgi:hypothetical protein